MGAWETLNPTLATVAIAVCCLLVAKKFRLMSQCKALVLDFKRGIKNFLHATSDEDRMAHANELARTLIWSGGQVGLCSSALLIILAVDFRLW